MQRMTLTAALAALGFVAGATADDAGLAARVTASDGWVAYHVPKVGDAVGPCCYALRGGAATKRGCNLEGRSWGFINDRNERVDELDRTLAVYLRVERGRIDRVRAVSASCPVETASTVRWIDPVEPANSVAVLSSVLDRNVAGDADDHAFVALAHHADDSATRALAARAAPSRPRKEREQALFWLGQTRGAAGAEVVEHHATTDADPEIRAHAIFALSQSAASDAYPHILAIAHRDPAEHVRSQSLFWLAQMGDARARDDILAVLNSESSDEVREQAVFALTQLDDGDAADEALISVVRGNYPRSIKKQALFWLGQSGSPRAIAYFDEALR